MPLVGKNFLYQARAAQTVSRSNPRKAYQSIAISRELHDDAALASHPSHTPYTKGT